MTIARRYVDGRHGVSGAQYINTALGQQGRVNNAKFSATTGSVKVVAARGISEGQEVLMTYGDGYWRTRREEKKRRDRDTRRGGMLAYTRHCGGRTIFVEEVVRATEAGGRGLRVGRMMFGRMLQRETAAEEVHLLVVRGNRYAYDMYTALGFVERPYDLYQPREGIGEVYMVARASVVAERIASTTTRVDTEWEMEVAESSAKLREEDVAWARRMYEEAHAGRKWEQ